MTFKERATRFVVGIVVLIAFYCVGWFVAAAYTSIAGWLQLPPVDLMLMYLAIGAMVAVSAYGVGAAVCELYVGARRRRR